MAKACLFCVDSERFVVDQVVAEFPQCVVLRDKYPVSEGHLLIVPREHVCDWFDASSELQRELMEVVEVMKGQLDEQYRPDGYNIGMNCGAAGGQTVMHLHVHLIPRYSGDCDDPRGGVRGVIPQRQHY